MTQLNQNQTESVAKQEKRRIVNQERIEEIQRIKTLNQKEQDNNSAVIDDDAQPYDKYEDENYREPLEIATEIKKRILLSWGGGSDGFDLYLRKDKDLQRGIYFLADWGQYEESELTTEEAELVYDFYMGGCFEWKPIILLDFLRMVTTKPFIRM